MDEKDALAFVITIGDDVWKNWSYLITLNIAVLGWLMQRHGLYNIREKLLATVGYSGFVLIVLFGMHTAYNKLDLASNELAYTYIANENQPTIGGIAEEFVIKSPNYCLDVLGNREDIQCKKYSDNLDFAYSFIILGWLFNIALFWYQGFWIAIRKTSK